jgi:hypothetical protein
VHDLDALHDTSAAVAVTVFRPGENQAVLVIAASGMAAVETRMRPRLGQSPRIVASRWSVNDLDAASEVPDRQHGRQPASARQSADGSLPALAGR